MYLPTRYPTQHILQNLEQMDFIYNSHESRLLMIPNGNTIFFLFNLNIYSVFFVCLLFL